MLHIDFMSLKNWGRGFALKASSIYDTQGCYSCVGGLQNALHMTWALTEQTLSPQ